MSDDADLTRLFAQEDPLPADEAFVAGVTARIAQRQRLTLAAPVMAAALLLLAVWASWPVAYTFSGLALTGLAMMTESLGAFFNSPAGMIAAGALLFTAALWRWLDDRVRGSTL